MKPKPYINSNFVSETGKLGSAELIAADGTSLEPLTTPASAAEIISGKEAYDDQGEKIEGTLDPSLPALTSPAAASDIISGKEAYDDQKQKITGALADGNEVYY